MPDDLSTLKTTAPYFATNKAGLIAVLNAIATGNNEDVVIAPELCQIPPHVAGLLAADLTAYTD